MFESIIIKNLLFLLTVFAISDRFLTTSTFEVWSELFEPKLLLLLEVSV